MDIVLSGLWEVIVDYAVDTPEVHTTSHQVRCDQNPYGACTKILHYCVSLKEMEMASEPE